MGNYQVWNFLRRIACAVSLIVLTTVCYLGSTLAAEALVIDQTPAPVSGAAQEAIVSKPSESVSDEERRVAKALAAIEAASGEEVFDLILRLQRKNDTLSPALLGIQKGFDNYVPIVEIARLLKFPSETDLSRGTISGYYFSEQNTFSLNAEQGTYSAQGETHPIPEESVIVNDLGQGIGDIYVKVDLLNEIWPLDFELVFSDLSLEINTRRKLPYELERERRKRQEELQNKEEEAEENLDLEFIPNPYKLYAPHSFNLSETFGYRQHEGLITNNVTVAGRGQLLGADADYALNAAYNNDGESPDIDNLRFRLTRKDYGDGALPLGLKEAQLGDIAVRTSPHISKAFGGRGIYVTSEDANTSTQSFDEVTLEGTGTPGWETELYRGNELLDFGIVNERGVYSFENVLLNYGKNTFRIVLYGPQGQVEEQIEERRITQKMLYPGQTNFSAAVIDNRQKLFDLKDEPDPPDKGFVKTARGNIGVNDWLTGFATITQIPTRDGKDESYVTLGGEISALGGVGQIEGYRQLSGGTAVDARFASRFAGVNFNLRGAAFNNFESLEAGYGDTAKKYEGEVRANKTFRLPFGSANLGIDTRHTEQQDGRDRTQIRTRQNFSNKQFHVANTLTTNLQNGNHSSTTGQITYSTDLSPKWNLNTQLNYDIYPDTEFDRARLDLRYNDRDKLTGALNISQGIRDTGNTRVGASAAYDFGTFLGGTDVTWNKGEGIDVLLSASTSLSPNGKDNAYTFSSKAKGTGSSLKVRIYHDINRNNEFDEGDEAQEGLKILINGRTSVVRSDENGILEIIDRGPVGLALVTLDRSSLENPFLVTAREGYKTVLRPKTKPFIDMPLVETGGIDGTVRFSDGRPVPGLRIQLVDGDGRIVDETTTSFDGFYSFEFVKPGDYIVRVDPSHQVHVPPRSVSVTSDDLFAYGVDLTLLEQAEEAPAVETERSGRVAQPNRAQTAGGTEQPAPLPTDGNFSAVVTQVRIGEHPYKVRLVLDLSAPASYRISRATDGTAVYIDLPDTAWDAMRDWQAGKTPILKDFEALALPGGGTRLRLTAKNRMDVFYHSLLAPNASRGHRLYVDFAETRSAR